VSQPWEGPWPLLAPPWLRPWVQISGANNRTHRVRRFHGSLQPGNMEHRVNHSQVWKLQLVSDLAHTLNNWKGCVERHNEPADGPALRSDGPRSGRSAPVGRTVRACAEQIRVPSFVLWLLAIFAELARNQLCKGSSPHPL
jgi:hypothetical protein